MSIDAYFDGKKVTERWVEKLLSNFPGDIGFSWQNQLNINLNNSDWSYEVDMNPNLAEC